VSGDLDVAVRLSRAQIAHVLRVATAGSTLGVPLAGEVDMRTLYGVLAPLMDDASLSRSTYRALLVLHAFPADGDKREVTDVARQLRLSPSTTHRYARTWEAIGLLEQDAASRQYGRIPDLGPRRGIMTEGRLRET
jgi:hypothetical protein